LHALLAGQEQKPRGRGWGVRGRPRLLVSRHLGTHLLLSKDLLFFSQMRSCQKPFRIQLRCRADDGPSFLWRALRRSVLHLGRPQNFQLLGALNIARRCACTPQVARSTNDPRFIRLIILNYVKRCAPCKTGGLAPKIVLFILLHHCRNR
jgi:hypothetical protein